MDCVKWFMKWLALVITQPDATPVMQGAHEMILEMVAWRDPNMVPIKAFYGDDTKVNYCGKLATDHHVQVNGTGD